VDPGLAVMQSPLNTRSTACHSHAAAGTSGLFAGAAHCRILSEEKWGRMALVAMLYLMFQQDEFRTLQGSKGP